MRLAPSNLWNSTTKKCVSDISTSGPDEILRSFVAHGAASLIGDGMWQSNDPRADAAQRLALRLMSATTQ